MNGATEKVNRSGPLFTGHIQSWVLTAKAHAFLAQPKLPKPPFAQSQKKLTLSAQ